MSFFSSWIWQWNTSHLYCLHISFLRGYIWIVRQMTLCWDRLCHREFKINLLFPFSLSPILFMGWSIPFFFFSLDISGRSSTFTWFPSRNFSSCSASLATLSLWFSISGWFIQQKPPESLLAFWLNLLICFYSRLVTQEVFTQGR